jgi:cell division protein FtsN
MAGSSVAVAAQPGGGAGEPAGAVRPSATNPGNAGRKDLLPVGQQTAETTAMRYTVQLGSFRDRANAEALLAKLTAVYEDGYIVESEHAGGALFRVVSGSFDSLDSALTREQALQIHGFTTYVRRLAMPVSEAGIPLQPLDGWRLVAEQVDAAKR